jgi:hypothetical protein
MSDPEIEELATEIEEGRDSIPVPEELLADAAPAREKNLQAQIAGMSVGERLKLALKGGREARQILIRDGSHLVQRFVLQNPRVTEEEIVLLAKNRNVDRELLEFVCKKKEWVANYQVRHALVTNPKTPLLLSMRYVRTLLMRDLRQLAKSKNVPSAVNSAAKRLVLERGG